MVIAGGIIMLPLLTCSVIALAIVIERFWTLQHKRVVPALRALGVARLDTLLISHADLDHAGATIRSPASPPSHQRGPVSYSSA